MDTPTALFVYGTLKEGQINGGLLTSHARGRYRAWTSGQLFDLGAFPAMVAGEGTVHGEVVQLDAQDVERVLAVLDRLEGYRADDEPGSLYLRRIVDVSLAGSSTAQAWAYLYNGDQQQLPEVEASFRIEDGEWMGPSRHDRPERNDALETFARHVEGFCS